MASPSSRVTFRQLEYALAVAEAGTMVGAAERLHVSQSAVSLAVSDLEKVLDVQLFMRRKAKGVALTSVGRTILPEIRRLVAQVDDLHSMARGLGETIEGTLLLGCFPTLTPLLMPRILSEFPRRHPSVHIELSEGPVEEMLQRLYDGRCEIALMYETSIPPEIATTVLFSFRPYLVFPAGHRFARQDGPIALADLRDEPMVMAHIPTSEDMFGAVFGSAGVQPNVRFRTSTAESVRSLVACGAGYSVMLHRPPRTATDAGPPLEVREIADSVPDVDVVLAHARSARLTRRANAFSDFCREVLTQPT
jgi:DNA-binding transcriptional LysR family regulator